jgi:hypothetical protein
MTNPLQPVQTLTRFHLDVDAIEQDKLSSRLLEIRHQGEALEDMPALQKKATAFLERVRYLEDALKTVEQDDVREAIVLRSETPEVSEGSLTYYEVLLHKSGQTQLGRKLYHRSSGETEAVDFTLTDRLLERLGKDLQELT